MQASSSAAGDHPGRFFVGPEEKYGITGRFAGLAYVDITHSRAQIWLSVGG